MQRLARLVAAMLFLSACTTSSDDATSTTTTPSSTTTPTSGPAATSESPTLRPIGRGVQLDPGESGIYESGSFPAFQVEFDLDGWVVDETGPEWIQFSNESPDAGPGVWGAVVAFRTDTPLDDLADYFLSPANQVGHDDLGDMTLNSRQARTIDVLVPAREPLGDPTTGPANYDGDLRCSQRVVFHVNSDIPATAPRPWTQGLIGCAWNRVVIVDVDGISMLLTVSPDERSFDHINELSELGPYVDDFTSAITFCTGAAACDD